MARAKSNGRLEEGLAILIQNQTAVVARMADNDQRVAETDRQKVEIDRQMAETNRINSERFARIEAILMEHTRILADHTGILEALRDAIREKIGFKGKRWLDATSFSPYGGRSMK